MPALIQVNLSCNKGTAENPGWSNEEMLQTIHNLAERQLAGRHSDALRPRQPPRRVPLRRPRQNGTSRTARLGQQQDRIDRRRLYRRPGQQLQTRGLYLDNNLIKGFRTVDHNSRRIFCNTDDLDTFSASYNQLTKVPDIFSSTSAYFLSSANFAYNQIDGFENADDGTYQGINVTTFTLSGQPDREVPRLPGQEQPRRSATSCWPVTA